MSFRLILLILILSGGYSVAHLVLLPTLRTTVILDGGEFRKIKTDSNKSVTNIVLVHGIGHHCIGYGDVFIRNLFKRLAYPEPSVSLEELYKTVKWNDAYLVIDQATGRPDPATERPDPSAREILDGGCLSRYDENSDTSNSALGFFGRDLDQMIDYDLTTTAQELLCEAIHTHNSQDVDCHLLHVEMPKPLHVETPKPPVVPPLPYLPTYITGFVRRVQVYNASSPSHMVRVYELTWSPATRWMKQSLGRLESVNRRYSNHLINRTAKVRMTNAMFSDALAYLSDNGVLINYNVFQAICLALSDSNLKEDFPYEFTCLPKHLQRAEKYSSENSVFLLSHSLGTQVLLDSLSMMVKGMDGQRAGDASDKECDLHGFIQLAKERLERIGARMPDWWRHICDSDRLDMAVKQFSGSVKSIYAFTNQLPLFAVRNTSPFRYRDYDIASEFQKFLRIRKNAGTSSDRLEIVSFHDPDDALSYNLHCWYRQSVVKHFPFARSAITAKISPGMRAQGGTFENSTDADQAISEVRRGFNDRLFDKCTPKDELRQTDLDVLAQINDARKGMGDARVVDASLRVESFRFRGLLVDPMGVHSTYFTNPTLPLLVATPLNRPGFPGDSTR